MAIGTGGLTGTGLWGEHVFVPNSWNDFIFSYLANAMGFVGAVTVLLLLLGISMRILLAALQSTDALGRYLCVGIFAALFWQCIINLGMNLQVLPVIGGHAAVLLGRRVQRGHGVFVRGAGAGGIPQEPPQKAGGAH